VGVLPFIRHVEEGGNGVGLTLLDFLTRLIDIPVLCGFKFAVIDNRRVDNLTIYRHYVMLCSRNRRWDFGDANPSPQGRIF
jgi:hypothetical protein